MRRFIQATGALGATVGCARWRTSASGSIGSGKERISVGEILIDIPEDLDPNTTGLGAVFKRLK